MLPPELDCPVRRVPLDDGFGDLWYSGCPCGQVSVDPVKLHPFIEGMLSINPYPSLRDNPEIARYMDSSDEERIARHWQEVGHHLVQAMEQFEDEIQEEQGQAKADHQE